MPVLLWLDIAALGFCMLLGASLLTTTLGAGSGLLGFSFAGFSALLTGWAPPAWGAAPGRRPTGPPCSPCIPWATSRDWCRCCIWLGRWSCSSLIAAVP